MLEITGSGYLKVEGYINNGIAAKETLRLDAANLEAVAVNNAIKSKSYIYVSDGNYILIAGNDGIKADKGEEDGVAGITIENGSFDITSFGDAVSAEGDLNIKDGEFAIVTNGGYDSALSAAQGFGKMENTMPENGMTGGMPSNGHIPSEG